VPLLEPGHDGVRDHDQQSEAHDEVRGVDRHSARLDLEDPLGALTRRLVCSTRMAGHPFLQRLFLLEVQPQAAPKAKSSVRYSWWTRLYGRARLATPIALAPLVSCGVDRASPFRIVPPLNRRTDRARSTDLGSVAIGGWAHE
jgi:hypothetical protein